MLTELLISSEGIFIKFDTHWKTRLNMEHFNIFRCSKITCGIFLICTQERFWNRTVSGMFSMERWFLCHFAVFLLIRLRMRPESPTIPLWPCLIECIHEEKQPSPKSVRELEWKGWDGFSNAEPVSRSGIWSVPGSRFGLVATYWKLEWVRKENTIIWIPFQSFERSYSNCLRYPDA